MQPSGWKKHLVEKKWHWRIVFFFFFFKQPNKPPNSDGIKDGPHHLTEHIASTSLQTLHTLYSNL